MTRVVALAALLFCAAGPASAQAVRLEFHDGKVNLTAQNASLRTILTEWARLGGTQVVNSERLSGAPVSLQLTNIPETQALDIILRGTAGYIAGLRNTPTSAASPSLLDRIMIVPTAGTAAVAGARPIQAPPPFALPRAVRQIDSDDNPTSDVPPDDERPVRVPGLAIPRAGQNQAPPQPFQPQDDDTPQQAPTTTAPANPFGIVTGSSRPGTITPVPQQPTPQRPQRDQEP
jgi:hypothetical protein